ncbi:MAG: hypothetical protein GY701_17295 [Sulfitobacter sp.]|nr:hypothetical protein [Sulfitobacter sp.]MCP5111178.1 hypothetical protein [bacterium]
MSFSPPSALYQASSRQVSLESSVRVRAGSSAMRWRIRSISSARKSRPQ